MMLTEFLPPTSPFWRQKFREVSFIWEGGVEVFRHGNQWVVHVDHGKFLVFLEHYSQRY